MANLLLAQLDTIAPILEGAERLGTLEIILVFAIIIMFYSILSQGRRSKAEQDNRSRELALEAKRQDQFDRMIETNTREAELRSESIADNKKLIQQLATQNENWQQQTETWQKLIREERDDRKGLRDLVTSEFLRANDTQTIHNGELLKALGDIRTQLTAVEKAVTDTDHTSKTSAAQRTQFEKKALQLLEGVQKSITHIESATATPIASRTVTTVTTTPNISQDGD